MTKFMKILAAAVLIIGAVGVSSAPALARHGGHGGGHWHGGYHGGWHGGGWRGGWRGGGFGFGWGWGYPYAYYPPSYYYPPAYYAPRCGWVRVRVWRNHHRYWRRVWRCW